MEQDKDGAAVRAKPPCMQVLRFLLHQLFNNVFF